MKLNIIFILIFFFFSNINSYSGINNTISLKIGNKIITNYEVKNKILTTLILSNQAINQNSIDKLKGQSLDSLIEKKVKEIELEKHQLKIDETRVLNYLNSIEELKETFKENNISFSLFKEEIEIQFKWQKFILNTYANQVKVNENIIDKEIEEILSKQKNVLQLRLSEIEFSINNNNTDQKKISEIINLINEIGFENVALKFSTSPSSGAKGDLGWVNYNSLSKKIIQVLKDLNEGDISKPIINSGSATILKVQKKRQSDVKNLNIENLRENLINRKRNELYNLYSQSLLSKLKNSTLIEQPNE
ncbi:peptidylprolyl isomerase [Candidatus Pelagibacter bacterium]|nr:peptidylprolyl isomerase [Candidatus Pelagibacter bacterium]